MATFHFVVSLGIIVLITSCLVHSGKIPPKTDSPKDKDDSMRLKDSPNEHGQEDQQSKFARSIIDRLYTRGDSHQLCFIVDFFPDESTNSLQNQAREIMKGKKKKVLKRGKITEEDKTKERQ